MALRPLSCITNAAASITWLVTNPQVDRYQIFGFCSCFVLSVASVALGFKPVGVAILAPCFFSQSMPQTWDISCPYLPLWTLSFSFLKIREEYKMEYKMKYKCIPWNTKWIWAMANSFAKRIQTPSSNNIRDDSTYGHHQMVSIRNQIDSILCSQRWRSSIWSAKTRLGADCGSDHEFLIAKFRHKLKKVRKTTRPFRYDLNQIPYDYIVEVTNRFKVLDL